MGCALVSRSRSAGHKSTCAPTRSRRTAIQLLRSARQRIDTRIVTSPRDTVEARLRAQYGQPGPARWIVVLYVNADGEVGGYRAGMAIMDSPVSFFDADGTLIGVFHIFAPAGENAKYQRTIDALVASYPIEQPFDVGPTTS
jgi:hypothetical protein